MRFPKEIIDRWTDGTALKQVVCHSFHVIIKSYVSCSSLWELGQCQTK
jgi:hypothetical protein